MELRMSTVKGEHETILASVNNLTDLVSSTQKQHQTTLDKNNLISLTPSYGILNVPDEAKTTSPVAQNDAILHQFHGIYESDEKVLNKHLQHSLIGTTTGKKLQNKEEAMKLFCDIVSEQDMAQLSEAIINVSPMKKKGQEGGAGLSSFIRIKSGSRGKVLGILRKHKNALNSSSLAIKSNTCLVTRTKKGVIGSIANALNELHGPKTACLPRHSLTAKLMYLDENVESKPVCMSYADCIDKFGHLIDEETKSQSYDRLNANFQGSKAAAILLF